MEAVTAGASSGFGSLAGAAANFTGGGGGELGGAGGGGGGGGGMSPELMDDLSKRLTTVEMKGIIQLTERGRRMEARAGALQAEKEDLFARLQVCGCERMMLVGGWPGPRTTETKTETKTRDKDSKLSQAALVGIEMPRRTAGSARLKTGAEPLTGRPCFRARDR